MPCSPSGTRNATNVFGHGSRIESANQSVRAVAEEPANSVDARVAPAFRELGDCLDHARLGVDYFDGFLEPSVATAFSSARAAESMFARE